MKKVFKVRGQNIRLNSAE